MAEHGQYSNVEAIFRRIEAISDSNINDMLERSTTLLVGVSFVYNERDCLEKSISWTDEDVRVTFFAIYFQAIICEQINCLKLALQFAFSPSQ